MKKKLILASFAVLAFAFAASAQKVTDFSGTWTLDKSKSTLDERMAASIESQTMVVTQTATELKAETTSKRAAPPADAPQGPPPGGGGGRMGGGGMMGGGGDGTFTYKLDGSETKTEVEGRMGKMPVSLKAKVDGSMLVLTRNSTFSSPMGEITITTTETWRLEADQKRLAVRRETVTPRGTTSAEFVYSKP